MSLLIVTRSDHVYVTKTLIEKLNTLREKFFSLFQQTNLINLKFIQYSTPLQMNTNISKQEITNVILRISKEKTLKLNNILNCILKLIKK